ncbi:YkvA family protein [Paenibacillus gorillae]|uniref:YkvA family protein n=1 Tax=Paenibacillus gorillae TaxID=1243662 RepID=UPI00307B6EF4
MVSMNDQYSEEYLGEKIKKFGKKAGYKIVYAALLLFFSLKDGNVPAWAKTVINRALTYFTSPVNAIPDIFPVAGFTDDLGALFAALGVIQFISVTTSSRKPEQSLLSGLAQNV